MTSVETKTIDALAADAGQREAWVKPEIVSFEAVVATQTNNGSNPGDGVNNAS